MPGNFITQLEYFVSIIPLTYVALFHVINPIGSGVLFYNITPGADGNERRRLAKKIAINAAVMLIIILMGGVYILKLFGITVPIVKICGGMVILAMGWRSLQKDEDVNDSDDKIKLANSIRGFEAYKSKLFYPFTFPFTVGPGTISVALTISAESLVHRGNSTHSMLQYAGAITSILLIAFTIYLCYGSTDFVMGRLSLQMRKVIMKIFSFILLCIGGQIVFGGIEDFIKYVIKAINA
ncbi:MarC family protein [Paraflavitalea speifideaquila]|uniref:MarC family protein n=1 Tax=Paraflavitalea speifideaquila TaxID=3076558 RepID=UPI0028E9094C|nr:MarC family protein [Paraflavitalea speifideiaquila]